MLSLSILLILLGCQKCSRLLIIYIAIQPKATKSQQAYSKNIKIHSRTSQDDNDILTSDQYAATDLAWRYESIPRSTIKSSARSKEHIYQTGELRSRIENRPSMTKLRTSSFLNLGKFYFQSTTLSPTLFHCACTADVSFSFAVISNLTSFSYSSFVNHVLITLKTKYQNRNCRFEEWASRGYWLYSRSRLLSKGEHS